LREIELGEIASYQNGYAFKPDDWSNKGLPIIRIQNLNDPGKDYNYYDGDDVDERYFVQDGDVLIAWSASLGVYVWNRGDAWLNQHTFKVNFENDEVDKSYFVYAIQEVLKKIENKLHGSTMKHITKKKFLKLKIPLPSLSEQKAIVAKLDRAQRLIDIDKEMLAKYDALIQSVFLEMFGDPVTNPKGWERVPFKKLAEIDKESFDPTDFKGSVEYVGLNSIVKDSGKIIDVETITEGDVKSNKYRFSPDHILYGKLRPYLNKVAFPDFNGICSTDILPMQAKEGISTKYFVGYLLKTKEFVNYADKNSSGANLPRISPTMVKKFEAFLPPLKIQRKFDDLVNKIISEKHQTAKASQKSEELFSSLVQGAFG